MNIIKNQKCSLSWVLYPALVLMAGTALAESSPVKSAPSAIDHSVSGKSWALKDVIRRVYDYAPEVNAMKQLIKAKYSNYKQAGKWPNPVLEFQSDNRLEKSGVRNGYQTNDVALSQSLSLTGRYAKKKKIAFTEYQHSLENGKWQRLQIEAKASGLFYAMQIAKAKLVLANTRLSESTVLQTIGRRRSRAGDLSRFQRDRLNIVREKSHQEVLFLTTQYKDAKNQLLRFLRVSENTRFSTLNVKFDLVTPLNVNTDKIITGHPKFRMIKLRLVQKRQNLSLARSKRLGDITVRVYQETDEFNNREDKVTGVGISVPLPIWNTRRHSVKSAKAFLERSRYSAKFVERDLRSDLASRSRHLKHLIIQIEHYRRTVLEPAKRIFYLSKRRFRIGDTGILILVDTINTYFEATNQYLTLVEAALKESVKYRLASGTLILPNGLKMPRQ